MVKSKAIDILRSLSKDELKQFRNFVLSPVHNKNRNVIKLLELTRKYAPEYNSPMLKKEVLFKKLFPGKKYSDIVMRILLSDFLKLAEEFLAYQYFKKDQFTEKIYLLRELKERKLKSLFKKHIKETDSDYAGKKAANSDYFLNRFNIESAKADFLISIDRQFESSRNLLEKSKNLLIFFLINSFSLIQEIREMEDVVNQRSEINYLEKFINSSGINDLMKYMKETEYTYYPNLEVYYYMYQTTKNGFDNLSFSHFRDSCKKNISLFDDQEQYNILMGLESCAVSRTADNDKRSYIDLMEVYELILNTGIISSDKGIPMQMNLFRNIFYTSVVLKKYEWAERFMNKYINRLLPEQRDDMLHYTSSVLYFERKQYESALLEISKVKQSNFVYKYETKILMLKIYYEIKAYENALSLIDTFNHFLTGNKIVSNQYKSMFVKFLKYLNKLIKIRMDHQGNAKNIRDAGFLRASLENEKDIVSRRWLMEKCSE